MVTMSAWIKLLMVAVLITACIEICHSLRCYNKTIDMGSPETVNCSGSCKKTSAEDVTVLECVSEMKSGACTTKNDESREQKVTVCFCNEDLCNHASTSHKVIQVVAMVTSALVVLHFV